MHDTAKVPGKPAKEKPAQPPVVDPELVDQLLARAEAGGMELLGRDGLLSGVTKAVLERTLGEEMTGHLGYEKHDPAARGSRNATTPKTDVTVCHDCPPGRCMRSHACRSPRAAYSADKLPPSP
jgi:hypothetical protein